MFMRFLTFEYVPSVSSNRERARKRERNRTRESSHLYLTSVFLMRMSRLSK